MGTPPFPMLHPGEIDDRIAREELPLAPVPVWDAPTLAACARLYHRYVEPGTGTRLPDAAFCDLPRWLFLEYLVRHCGVLLVGANEPDLAYLCPIVLARNVHGWNRPRLLGFTESMTPLFHAVRDRARLCQRSASVETVIVLRGRETDRDLARCYFGLDYRILPQAPWRSGTIYLYARPHRGALPANTPEVIGAEHDRVRPLATLSVQPWDWPLLAHVAGMDVVAQHERIAETFDGYPWANDTTIHPSRSRRSLAEETRAYLDTHYDAPLCLADLGKRVGVSPFTLLRRFRASVGLSPHEYQTLRRIDHAKRLLRSGETIARAAVAVGYCDQSHLTRHFQQIVGLTPGDYGRLQ